MQKGILCEIMQVHNSPQVKWTEEEKNNIHRKKQVLLLLCVCVNKMRLMFFYIPHYKQLHIASQIIIIIAITVVVISFACSSHEV